MAFDFPTSPLEGTVYAPPGGPTYVYTGGVWRVAASTAALGLVPTAETRNRVVNGAMQHSQELGNALLGPITGLAHYVSDQWIVYTNTAPGTLSAQRVQVTTPNGSKDRLRFVVGTAKAVLAAGDYATIIQYIEGARVADFRYGSASAKQAVLRFGWKSPAGTYSIKLGNGNSSRTFLASFTIAAGVANTETEQVIAIPGDVTGTWANDSALGITFCFTLAAGTTYQGVAGWQAGNLMGTASNSNGMATAGAVFELFDVGLYLDDRVTGVPPRFEVPDEAAELIACCRYFETSYDKANAIGSATSGFREFFIVAGLGSYQMPGAVFTVRKRVVPALTLYPANGGAAGNVQGVASGAPKAVNLEAPTETAFNMYPSLTSGDLVRFHYVANARM